jgi:hypothetical protein
MAAFALATRLVQQDPALSIAMRFRSVPFTVMAHENWRADGARTGRMLFSDLPLELLCDGALSLRSSRRGFVIMAGEALIALTIVVTGMYLLI